jgi:hypothetical protein
VWGYHADKREKIKAIKASRRLSWRSEFMRGANDLNDLNHLNDQNAPNAINYINVPNGYYHCDLSAAGGNDINALNEPNEYNV